MLTLIRRTWYTSTGSSKLSKNSFLLVFFVSLNKFFRTHLPTLIGRKCDLQSYQDCKLFTLRPIGMVTELQLNSLKNTSKKLNSLQNPLFVKGLNH